MYLFSFEWFVFMHVHSHLSLEIFSLTGIHRAYHSPTLLMLCMLPVPLFPWATLAWDGVFVGLCSCSLGIHWSPSFKKTYISLFFCACSSLCLKVILTPFYWEAAQVLSWYLTPLILSIPVVLPFWGYCILWPFSFFQFSHLSFYWFKRKD